MYRLWGKIGVAIYWLLWPLVYIYAATTRARIRVIIEVGDDILLVQNWLGPGHLSLPGGGRSRREAVRDAAQREIQEELGFSIDPSSLVDVGVYTVHETGGMPIKSQLLSIELPTRPTVHMRHLEIIRTSWVARSEIAHLDSPSTRRLLAIWAESIRMVE